MRHKKNKIVAHCGTYLLKVVEFFLLFDTICRCMRDASPEKIEHLASNFFRLVLNDL